jgi:NAD+-dependent protein deacetylase sirtuin 4
VTIEALRHLTEGRRVVVLTGAGCSTESGIPDYRGPETARRARNPVQYRAFTSDPEARRRYWARSMIGWPRFQAARPNAAHHALAAAEEAGLIAGVITQNVDRLHHVGGSRQVVELHGALAEVRCLDCGALSCRAALQQRLEAQNPGWREEHATLAPDGDADAEALPADFTVTPCEGCGGVLKPNVVFFGEAVPRAVVDAAFRLFDEAEALLVVGSSLAVFSGYRFVRRAAERGLPIGIVNLGSCRGDAHAAARVDGPAGRVLSSLFPVSTPAAG